MSVLTNDDWENIISKDSVMLSALKYGSSTKKLEKARDIDLFIIYDKPPKEKTINYRNKQLFDINQVSLQEVYCKVQLWDIDFTEPILTGYTIKGNREIEQYSKNYLLNNKPNSTAIDYIKKRSVESLIQTEQLIVQIKYELLLEKVNNDINFEEIKRTILKQQEPNIKSSNFDKAINQLNYALSYYASAKRYEKKQAPIIFNDLINCPRSKAEELLFETRNYQKQDVQKNFGDFVNYYKKAENIIKR
ncbi:hypothetical protein KO361_04960 [Candidatus Woesearchaeota archaeon]|nr:hypothetical protein [Candidatus Woesearchaeota archaeon]